MKRKLAIGMIVCYLGALSFGVVAHALQYRQSSHPGMYFIVWDMFCGWAGYETRLHIIGEGESGRYYELAPGPWKEIRPYGDLARHHYDSYASHTLAIARNTLNHTAHEPIQRVFVVEENWAKKFNLPDELWQARYPDEKNFHSYYHLRQTYSTDGKLLASQASWFDYQANLALNDNPRLAQDSRRARPFFQVHPLLRSREPEMSMTPSLEPTGSQLVVQSVREN
jgi:hypothetical protein